jgi:YVTN family beta-propeller protein
MPSRLRFGLRAIATGLAVLIGLPADAGPERQSEIPTARLRRPVAAAFLDDGRTLCVANHRSGSVSVVDVPGSRLCAEVPVGQRLTGLAVLPDRKYLLAVDEERHELIALARDGTALAVRARLAVPPYPASVAVGPDGRRATVACLWSRCIAVINLGESTDAISPRVVATIRLPFAPRDQCVLPGGSRVVVADAFAGHLAVVDVAAGRLVAVHRLNGHNLRGLSLTADGTELLVAHQILDHRAPTTRENVASGALMANVLRRISVDRLLTPGTDLEAGGPPLRLPGGDPAGVAVAEGEPIAVALAGVNELALLPTGDTPARRVAVGRRPTVALTAGAGRPVVVLNTFDDSLSLVDADRGRVTGTITLGSQQPLGPQERGELLFHDARLALGGGMSCHSCHTDGHTNGLLSDTLGDGSYGTPKRVLTLRNTALTDPWAWNGQVKYLHDQVRKSLVETLHASAVRDEQVNDLVSFLHTLPAPPPLEPVTADPADRARVERGRQFFHDRGCVRCHIAPLTFTSQGAYDVGFADEHGHRTFNPPSLRGVGQGYGFLHDNRAATLEQLFTKFRHKVGPGLPADDLADLLRYLRSL